MATFRIPKATVTELRSSWFTVSQSSASEIFIKASIGNRPSKFRGN